MENLLFLNKKKHPLDVIEEIIDSQSYTFKRSFQDELDLWISSKNLAKIFLIISFSRMKYVQIIVEYEIKIKKMIG